MKKRLLKYFSVLFVVVCVFFAAHMIAKADTFYKTFISECESEEWFISYINSKFIENGKRFTQLTSAEDPVLLNITELNFPTNGAKKIPAAVKYLKNLEKVNLSYNEISDITNLNLCTSIKYINIDGNNISSVDFSSFKFLKEVSAALINISIMPNLNNNTVLEKIDLSK